MTQTTEKLKQRADKKSAKRQVKKDEIAQSAIKALRDLGYANTALRDIAAHCDLSLGMLHYYFDDKEELIIHCVRLYKEGFVKDLQTATQGIPDLDAFYAALATSLVQDWKTHRLWYDMRIQAMFDDSFKPVVAQIEADLINLVSFMMGPNTPVSSARQGYALLDGIFLSFIQTFCMGDKPSHDEIMKSFGKLRF